MIMTVTLNPAVDKLYLVDDLLPETVMRVREVSNTAGGKGLNVARVAALCGEAVCALGFLGGHNGRYVRSLLAGADIEDRFTEVEAETRSCINIRSLQTGRHTELLEPGVTVSKEDCRRFLLDYRASLPECDVLTISGSLPDGAPEDFYLQLIQEAKLHNIPVMVDTSGASLRAVAQAAPALLKPNADEIAQLVQSPLSSTNDYIEAAARVHRGGVGQVVVSLGAQGAVMACSQGLYRAETPPIKTVNTVGCGDSMLAGFAVAKKRGLDAAEALRYASAISTVNAMTMQTGYFRLSDLDMIYPQIIVTEIE